MSNLNRYGAQIEQYESLGSIPDERAVELLSILIDGEHSNWDGWSNWEKQVINRFIKDLLLGLSVI